MDSTTSELKIVSFSTVSEHAVCRLCASRSQQTVNVFDKEVEALDLINTISQCLQIKISIDDILPKDVCVKCCEILRGYSDFFTLCSDSQLQLAELYNCTPDEVKTANSRAYPITERTAEVKGTIVSSSPDISQKASQRTSKRKLRKPMKIVAQKKYEYEITGVTKRTCNGKSKHSIPAQETDGNCSDDTRITIKKAFQNYNWECTVCDENLNTLGALKSHHQESHNRPADFKCTKCGKIYTRYRSFVRHVKLHNDPKRFTCETCGKKFSQKTVLQSHQTVHTEERPHVCPQCGKAFKQFSSLYLHSRSHLPEQAKPKFHCPVCKKMFSSKHTMENHSKIHTGEKNFSCDICGKTFIAKGSLNYHLLSHDDLKNHSCSLCKKSFKTARLLAKHSTLHTGIKPHQCDVCGKQFRERSALKEHARIHTGAMPYVCEYCGKKFRFKGILTVHIRQHTGERPYRCNDCCRNFTNWANYNKHVKRRHDQTVEPSSPPSVSLPSLDFCDPCDLPLSADGLNIQDFVVDPDIFKLPSSYSNQNGINYYPHLPM
ncbi:hypothetical protein GE061_002310 [Apolygus lucorum]|uniref:Protein krueppel n=1 Tax=Apolygus lucorum TaxID=248454 RepID=A0A6A4JFM7_APOLU|nr:hypothetical protein GE061_002310 [Apolygus lucorum]